MFVQFIKKSFQTSSCLGILAISLSQVPVSAQVIEDGTLPTSVKTTDNLNFKIDSINNKNRVGNNSFHSFKEFSIPAGGSAIFNNSTDVVNIINRVTGGNISNIDGLIKANGNANLFLINPAGIVFGKNARLDIGGSFFGSTAESIKFADDIEFSAIDPTKKPLLTVNVPLGLQMGSNSKRIEVQGDGYTTANDTDEVNPLIVTNLDGLRVKPGNTLALVGGEVSLSGGIVAADSGRVELGGVNSGLVNINSTTKGWSLGYETIQKFGDIKLNSMALADASGMGSSSIQLQGQNISIRNGSKVFMHNGGSELKGEIKANATESIEIALSKENNFRSGFFTQTLGMGSAAQIAISTPRLQMSSGTAIISQTFSSGKGGNITIDASQSVQISKFTPDASIPNRNSGAIQSIAYAIGDSGNISVSTEKLTIVDGGIILSGTFGNGSGGDVNIDSKSIQLTGINFDTFSPSLLSASTLGIGNAGNLTVNTRSLIVKDGGRIDSATLASGAAGSVTVNAKDFIEVSGTVPGSINPSLIISSANIVDESLRQFLKVPAIPSGDSGNVDINTPVLKVSDGAEVTVRNDGTGKGGILNINADLVSLNSKGKITASTQSGGGGNIDLQVKDGLILTNQSLIDSESLGTGDGGNININSPVIAGLENSDIIANAVEGNGGNIKVNTSGLFGLKFQDELTSKSDITASSQFGVNGTVEINNPAIDPSSSLTELPSDVVDGSQKIASGCSANQGNSFTVIGKGGLPTNPADVITNVTLWNDLRNLSLINNGKKTSIQVKNDSFKPIVEATGWIVDNQGNIEFVADSNTRNNWYKASNCQGKVVN